MHGWGRCQSWWNKLFQEVLCMLQGFQGWMEKKKMQKSDRTGWMFLEGASKG